MPITSTQINVTQKGDNLLSVEQVHTFASGRIVRDGARVYPSVEAMNAHAPVCATNMNSEVKARELFDAVFTYPWNYVLEEATNTELGAYIRELYRNSNKETLAKAAKRILEWITNGRFTDTQVRNAFGLTAGQWTTLKTKMQNLVASHEQVETAVGE